MAEIGITLRNARVQRGLTVDQVAQETRISPRFLEALEAEAFDDLPAPVYVRGFLRSYANFLQLDAQPLLEKLAANSDSPIVGPDSFVGGPPAAQPQRPARQTNDPFKRTAPGPRRTPPPPPAMPRSGTTANSDDAWDDDEDEGWAPDVRPSMPAAEDRYERRYAPGPEAFDDLEVDAYPEDRGRFRPRGVAGVLTERPDVGGDAAAPARVLAIAAGGVAVVLFVLVVAVILTKGGGDDSNAAGVLSSATPTSRPGTVIAVGSLTRPSTTAGATASATPSAGASPSASPTASETPGATETATTAASTPTRAPTTAPAPTDVPTTAPEPTATPTPVPTAEPTAVPTPTSPPSQITVFCLPDGTWVVSPSGGADNPNGFPTRRVDSLDQATAACAS